MINNVTLVGRLTKGVDLRYSQSGKAIANFTLACNRPFKNAQGQNEADFINTVQFGKGAETTAQYMKKGSLVGVTGRIQTRSYENNEGRTIYVTEVVADSVQFLEPRNQSNQKPQETVQDHGQPIDFNDDDLPF